MLVIMALSGPIALFSFAASHRADLAVHPPNITIESNSGNYFIDTSCIEDIIREQTGVYEGHPVCKHSLKKLNETINSIAFTDHVKTFRTISGKLGVEIALRSPVIRIIGNNYESFYIDESGYVFPLSELHTARVIIATGDIGADIPVGANVSKKDEEGNKAAGEKMAGLFELASFIHGDAFWKAFIDHIYVLPNGKLELIPKNGYHIIEFGRPESIEEKFGKLKAFYLFGLPGKGWHYYRRVNLEYNNQIICSK